MKILGISGSPIKNSNTDSLVEPAAGVLAQIEHDTHWVVCEQLLEPPLDLVGGGAAELTQADVPNAVGAHLDGSDGNINAGARHRDI